MNKEKIEYSHENWDYESEEQSKESEAEDRLLNEHIQENFIKRSI